MRNRQYNRDFEQSEVTYVKHSEVTFRYWTMASAFVVAIFILTSITALLFKHMIWESIALAIGFFICCFGIGLVNMMTKANMQ